LGNDKGKGWGGALSAMFAAVSSDAVQQLNLKQALNSFNDLATAESYQGPRALLWLYGLSHFDLPDCYRALANKQLKQIKPRGALPLRD
jgi:hypothetical protein